MIATAAEANPTCFSPSPLSDLIETFTPAYVRLVSASYISFIIACLIESDVPQARYLGNHFSNAKFCSVAFKGANVHLKKADRQALHQQLQKAKKYDDLDAFVGGRWNGEEEMRAIEQSLEKRVAGHLHSLDPPPPKSVQEAMEKELLDSPQFDAENATDEQTESAVTNGHKQSGETTPTERKNPEPVTTNAPLMPSAKERLMKPALISGEDVPTPSPTPAPACV